MKYVLLLSIGFALSACTDDRPRVNGIVDLTDNPSNNLGLFCYDGVKYLSAVGGGLTAKIDPLTRQPELCTE